MAQQTFFSDDQAKADLLNAFLPSRRISPMCRWLCQICLTFIRMSMWQTLSLNVFDGSLWHFSQAQGRESTTKGFHHSWVALQVCFRHRKQSLLAVQPQLFRVSNPEWLERGTCSANPHRRLADNPNQLPPDRLAQCGQQCLGKNCTPQTKHVPAAGS